MTVCISLTNEIEAIVIADAKVNFFERESNSVNKIGIINYSNGNAVVCGSGDGNNLWAIINNLDKIRADTLDEIVFNIYEFLTNVEMNRFHNWLEDAKRNIYVKASLIEEEKERNDFIRSQIGGVANNYDDFFKRIKTQTQIMVVGYENSKIRNFFTGPMSKPYEVFSNHIEIGSGMDGANFYFLTKLQGIKTKDLKVHEILFYCMNAFSLATINVGVGGTPTVVYLSSGGVKIFNSKQANALTNLSGAYLSEISPAYLTKNKMKELIFNLINDENGDKIYNEISELINLPVEKLVGMPIPYSSWQINSNKI